MADLSYLKMARMELIINEVFVLFLPIMLLQEENDSDLFLKVAVDCYFSGSRLLPVILV